MRGGMLILGLASQRFRLDGRVDDTRSRISAPLSESETSNAIFPTGLLG